MSEPEVTSLTGVVKPVEEIDESPFGVAAEAATASLEVCQERLRLLRSKRESINAEVALLVAQEKKLTRMAKIASEPLTPDAPEAPEG